MRGTVNYIGQIGVRGRFIPARAGNSAPAPRSGWRRSVHPRACGEQDAPVWNRCSVAGSSPRVRGTDDRASRTYPPVRFIPARAGNRTGPIRSRPTRPVHPRACGEQLMMVWRVMANIGSSPRVRGTVTTAFAVGGPVRFIPARAGNRLAPDPLVGLRPVHPRACGEQVTWLVFAATSAGSSPRVRGTAREAT